MVGRSCCPRTRSTRSSGWPIGWRSSVKAAWSLPTPSDHLRANAPRILRLRFDGDIDPGVFSGQVGVENTTVRDGQIELHLTGELRPVLETALRYPLVDLTVRHADLDELFRSYYASPTTDVGGSGIVNVEIATLDLSFRRKSTIGYTIGMALYVLVIVVLYPSFKDATNLDQLGQNSPGVAALFGISGSLTSPTGWLSANIYANFFPLMILLITIGYGAWCIAGQEADGRLELVMSLPFARRKVVLQKSGCWRSWRVVFSVVVFLCVLVGERFELTFDVASVAGATLGVALLEIDFGVLALAVGSATGSRGGHRGCRGGCKRLVLD